MLWCSCGILYLQPYCWFCSLVSHSCMLLAAFASYQLVQCGPITIRLSLRALEDGSALFAGRGQNESEIISSADDHFSRTVHNAKTSQQQPFRQSTPSTSRRPFNIRATFCAYPLSTTCCGSHCATRPYDVHKKVRKDSNPTRRSGVPQFGVSHLQSCLVQSAKIFSRMHL